MQWFSAKAFMTIALLTSMAIAQTPASSPATASPVKVDRAIRGLPPTEPGAKVDKRFVLLDTGGDTPRWLVVWGEQVFYDRNGNGDLSDKDEMTVAEVKDHHTPLFRNSKATALAEVKGLAPPLKGLTVEWDPTGANPGVHLTTGEGGKLCFTPLANEPAKAHVFRWGDGTRQWELYKFAAHHAAHPDLDKVITVRIGRFAEPGVATEESPDRCLISSRWEGLPEKVNPVADVVFVGADGKDMPAQRVELSHRCCGSQFSGVVKVPEWKEARVTLSFPDAPANWSIEPLTVTVKNGSK